MSLKKLGENIKKNQLTWGALGILGAAIMGFVFDKVATPKTTAEVLADTSPFPREGRKYHTRGTPEAIKLTRDAIKAIKARPDLCHALTHHSKEHGDFAWHKEAERKATILCARESHEAFMSNCEEVIMHHCEVNPCRTEDDWRELQFDQRTGKCEKREEVAQLRQIMINKILREELFCQKARKDWPKKGDQSWDAYMKRYAVHEEAYLRCLSQDNKHGGKYGNHASCTYLVLDKCGINPCDTGVITYGGSKPDGQPSKVLDKEKGSCEDSY